MSSVGSSFCLLSFFPSSPVLRNFHKWIHLQRERQVDYSTFHKTEASENIGLDWGLCPGSCPWITPYNLFSLILAWVSRQWVPTVPPQPWRKGSLPLRLLLPLWGGWLAAWLCQKAAWPPATTVVSTGRKSLVFTAKLWFEKHWQLRAGENSSRRALSDSAPP